MAKGLEKQQAVKMRRQGKSISDIACVLNVSKGSVSSWCREIILTPKQKECIRAYMIERGHQGRMIGAETNHKRKIENIERAKREGEKILGSLSKRDLLIAGIALYWGEGTKSDKGGLSFTNSDPDAIIFMCWWFQDVFGIKKEEFMPRVFINEAHRNRIKDVLQFWSQKLKLPVSQFGKPVLLKVPHKKVYQNHDTYYGVLSLRIRKSTNLKYQVLGLVKALKRVQ